MVSKYPLDVWKNNTITSNILSQLSNKCPKLEALTIHEGYLNYQKVSKSNSETVSTAITNYNIYASDQNIRVSAFAETPSFQQLPIGSIKPSKCIP